MLAVHLVTVRLLAAAWTAPKVSEEEGSYASRFYRWFLESYNSCLLLQGPSLMVPAMIVYDVATKVLGTE